MVGFQVLYTVVGMVDFKYCMLLLVWLVWSTVCYYWYGWFQVLYAIIGMVGFKYCILLLVWLASSTVCYYWYGWFQVLYVDFMVGVVFPGTTTVVLLRASCLSSLLCWIFGFWLFSPTSCLQRFVSMSNVNKSWLHVGVCVCGCDCSTELIIWENISPLL